MGVHEKIMAALLPLGLPVAPDLFDGREGEFITFSLPDDRGGDFGDGTAQGEVASIQVHYFGPIEKDWRGLRSAIRRALVSAGATYPEVIDRSNIAEHERHLVFLAEWEEGAFE